VKNDKKRAPLDTEYFGFLTELAARIGASETYAIFCAVWELAEKEPDRKVAKVIDGLVTLIPTAFRERARLWFNVLYMGMVSEENYPNTILGKRIKRLGVHQLLFDGMTAEEAANWSRDKPWRELDKASKDWGF
jgi:hypothetical protein